MKIDNDLLKKQLETGVDNVDGGELGGIVLTMNEALTYITDLEDEKSKLENCLTISIKVIGLLIIALLMLVVMFKMLSYHKEYWKESYCIETARNNPPEFCLEYEWVQTIIEIDSLFEE